MRSLNLQIGRFRRLHAKSSLQTFYVSPRRFLPSVTQASSSSRTPRSFTSSTVIINPGQSPEELLGNMVSNISKLSGDDIANCFTTLGRNVKPNTHFDFKGMHFQSLINRVYELRDTIQGTAIGKVLLGTAYLRYKDRHFLELVYDIVDHRFPTLSSRDIARVIISMHWLNYKNQKILDQCLRQLPTILPDLDQQLLIFLVDAVTSFPEETDVPVLGQMVTLIRKGELRDHQVVLLLSAFVRKKYYNQEIINSLIDRSWPQGIDTTQIREMLRYLTLLYPHVNLPRATLDLLINTVHNRGVSLQLLTEIIEDLITIKYQNLSKIAFLKRKTKFAPLRTASALESGIHICALLKENRESHLIRHFITEMTTKYEKLSGEQISRLLRSLSEMKIYNDVLIPKLCKDLRGKTSTFNLKQTLQTFSTITSLKYNDVTLFRELISRAFSDPALTLHDCYQIMIQMKKVMVEKSLRDALEHKLMMFLTAKPFSKTDTFMTLQFLPAITHYLAISHSRHDLVKVIAKLVKEYTEAGAYPISNQIDALHYLILLKITDIDLIQLLWKNVSVANPADLDYAHRRRLCSAYTLMSAQLELSIDVPPKLAEFIKEGPQPRRLKIGTYISKASSEGPEQTDLLRA